MFHCFPVPPVNSPASWRPFQTNQLQFVLIWPSCSTAFQFLQLILQPLGDHSKRTNYNLYNFDTHVPLLSNSSSSFSSLSVTILSEPTTICIIWPSCSTAFLFLQFILQPFDDHSKRTNHKLYHFDPHVPLLSNSPSSFSSLLVTIPSEPTAICISWPSCSTAFQFLQFIL